MAATVLAHPGVQPLAPRPSRPQLVVLPGGRSSAGPVVAVPEAGRSFDRRADARRRMYLQRRLAAFAVVVVATLAAAMVVSALLSPASGAESIGGATSYEVVAGDTLWSIAGSLDAGGDRREVVHLLAEANGGTSVWAGQELVIPAAVAEMID